MRSTIDPIKLLASRFVSLPPSVRMKITATLLRWREENPEALETETKLVPYSCLPRKSLVEKFWDEVEAAHGDGLYPTNPFADEGSQLLPYAVKNSPEQHLACSLKSTLPFNSPVHNCKDEQQGAKAVLLLGARERSRASLVIIRRT